jgi:hypothetical protein
MAMANDGTSREVYTRMILKTAKSFSLVRQCLARAVAISLYVVMALGLGGIVLGQRNDELLDAQRKLVDLGYSTGSPDGVMGARTQAALKKFQTDNKLPATGILDRRTLESLMAATGIPATPVQSPGVEKFLDSAKALMERSVETRAVLTMMQKGGANPQVMVWTLTCESPEDQVTHLSALPFPEAKTSWRRSVISSEIADRVNVRSTPGTRGVLVFERFDDVALLIGAGSEVRFDPEHWVELYGERFRKGGIHVSKDRIEFLEGTERLVDNRLFTFKKDSWARGQSAPVVAALERFVTDDMAVEAFPENAEWAQALAAGTLSAYNAFLQAHPDTHRLERLSGVARYEMVLPVGPVATRSDGVTVTRLGLGGKEPTATSVVGPDAAQVSEVLVTINGKVIRIPILKAKALGLVQDLGGGVVLKAKDPGPATAYVTQEGGVLKLLALE